MKMRITYKSPDALHYAVEDAMQDFQGDKYDRREKQEELMEQLLEVLGDTEYLTVEVDTEAKTVKVVK